MGRRGDGIYADPAASSGTHFTPIMNPFQLTATVHIQHDLLMLLPCLAWSLLIGSR